MTTQSKQQELFDQLKQAGIEYQTFEHEPVFTVAESHKVKDLVPGGHTKNLFLKDDKQQLWLISAMQDTKINLRQVSKQLFAKNLRFAQPELLREYLGVEPGSVTWFALVNDKKDRVKAVLDKRLFSHEHVGFHPLKNNATTVVKPDDLILFAESLEHSYQIFDFDQVV